MSVAMTAPPLGPSSVEVLRPRRMMMLLSVIGAIGFVAGAAVLMVWQWSNPAAIVIGPLGIAFFGWAAVVGIRRTANPWSMSISPAGFTIPSATYESKWIRWSDVESIGVFKVGRQKLVGVRLTTYANLVPQYSPEEVRIALRRARVLRGFTQVSAPLAPPVSSISPADVDAALTATAKASDIAGMFANHRAAYGYDIVLGWVERDRGADAFAAYLQEHRRKFAHA
jgi:hypothetical protein